MLINICSDLDLRKEMISVNVLAREVQRSQIKRQIICYTKNDWYPVLFLSRCIFVKKLCIYCVTSVRINLEVTANRYSFLFHGPVKSRREILAIWATLVDCLKII